LKKINPFILLSITCVWKKFRPTKSGTVLQTALHSFNIYASSVDLALCCKDWSTL